MLLRQIAFNQCSRQTAGQPSWRKVLPMCQRPATDSQIINQEHPQLTRLIYYKRIRNITGTLNIILLCTLPPRLASPCDRMNPSANQAAQQRLLLELAHAVYSRAAAHK